MRSGDAPHSTGKSIGAFGYQRTRIGQLIGEYGSGGYIFQSLPEKNINNFDGSLGLRCAQ